MDETLALPSEKAAEIALRTQQLIAFETGASNVVDPLGGSYFIENLTDKIEEKAETYFTEIDNLGGVINAIEDGYFQREISMAASDYQSKIDNKDRIVVGVNKFVNKNEEIDIPTFLNDIYTEFDVIKKEFNTNDSKFIILLDLTIISNDATILDEIISIINKIHNHLMNNIDRFIVYKNDSRSQKILNYIEARINRSLFDKIIADDNIKQIINTALYDNNMLNSISHPVKINNN